MEDCRNKRYRPQRVCDSLVRQSAMVETPPNREKTQRSLTAVESLLRTIILHKLHREHVPDSYPHRITATAPTQHRRRLHQPTNGIADTARRKTQPGCDQLDVQDRSACGRGGARTARETRTESGAGWHTTAIPQTVDPRARRQQARQLG